MVVAAHFVVEHFALGALGVRQERILDDLENLSAHVIQLLLDLALIRLDKGRLVDVASTGDRQSEILTTNAPVAAALGFLLLNRA